MDYPYETNGLTKEQANNRLEAYRNARTVYWTAKGLKITRLRLLSDPGFPMWDVSYCEGKIGNEFVIVSLPFFQLPKKAIKKTIVAAAIKDNVYAKGLGILDDGVISKLW